MKIFSFNTELFLPQRQAEIFSFFSDAANLERLTPPWLNFEILTPRPLRMEVGTHIDYRLKLRGITIRWQSEITVWDPPHCFVDRQTRGPYRIWNHQHTFLKCARGTLVRDSVEYATYGGWLVRKFLIEPDLKRIFEYRRRKLREIFSGDQKYVYPFKTQKEHCQKGGCLIDMPAVTEGRIRKIDNSNGAEFVRLRNDTVR